MFGKLKDKLRSWVKKVSDETPEEKKEEKIIENTLKTKKEEKKKQKKKERKSKKEEKSKVEKELPPIEKTETISEILEEDKIDRQLKKEVKKEKYVEPERKFNAGTESFEPDLEKTEKIVEKTILDGPKTIESKIKKKSFFRKFSGKKTISEESFDKYSEDLEMLLLENNVALEVAEKIIAHLKEKLVGQEIPKKQLEKKIQESLKEIIEEVLIEPFTILEKIRNKKEKPYIILFCGINGTGKTTTIAKITNLLKTNKKSSVMAAGDTFRAASIEQLNKHGEKLKTKVISHEYGSDPASVGFDAIKYAEKNKLDAVLIDTAGRMHTAKNLLQEMQKIKRVCKPDLTIFIGESITGNDSTEQVKAFDETIGIDAIILNKADIDEKGGTALSVGHTTNKPIIYLGTGQEYNDIEPFNKKKFIEKLGL